METNINIDEELYRAASQKAANEGVSISDVVEKALREFLAKPPYELRVISIREALEELKSKSAGDTEEESQDKQGRPKFELPVFRGGKGPMPGVNIDSRRELYDFLDDDYERLRRKGR